MLRPFGSRSTRLAVLAGLVFAAHFLSAWNGPAHAQGIANSRQSRPPQFAVEPRTPLDRWGAADYLIRAGRITEAIPLLNQFMSADPDNETMLAVRDRYGIGSILRLQDDPQTRPAVEPLLRRIEAGIKARATDPARTDSAIALLTRSPQEQTVGVDRLRAAGPYAVPELIRRLGDPALDPADRALILSNMSRLDTETVPPLIAALDSPDPGLVKDVADLLGRLRDRRAIPRLATLAARPETPEAVRDAAGDAIQNINGRSSDAHSLSPARLLADQSWGYLQGAVNFPSGDVEVWNWQGDAPAPKPLPASEAARALGRRLAVDALAIDPDDPSARAVSIAYDLSDALDAARPDVVIQGDPTGAFDEAVAAGPEVLGRVLRFAVAEGRSELASTVAVALTKVDAAGSESRRLLPLITALKSADRRVEIAAASAILGLDSGAQLAEELDLVPILSRFLTATERPEAVVVDGSPAGGNQVAGLLADLGYRPQVAVSCAEGFRLAAESAAVEFVIVEPTSLQGAWGWIDLMTNLRADSRTAGLPVFVIGTMARNDRLAGAISGFPRTGTLVATPDLRPFASQLNRGLDRLGARPLSAEDRRIGSVEAAALLARIARDPRRLETDSFAAIEPILSAALLNPPAAPSVSIALGSTPSVDAQRSLAAVLTDPSRAPEVRREAAGGLERSLERFGPLLKSEQVDQLRDAADAEPDPELRARITRALDAYRPRVVGSGYALEPTDR